MRSDSRLGALTAALIFAATAVFAEAPPPSRTQTGDIDDIYIKPGSQSPWGSLLSSFGLGSFQKSHALIIGISDFDAYADLPTASDPLRIRDYLIEDAGFDVVVTLTGRSATKARIAELMVDDFPESVGENDRFLFYWSGHGVTRQRGEAAFGFLPLADSPQGRHSSMVAMADLARWDQFLEAKQVLYLLDSCFSGLAGVAPQSDLRQLNEGQLMGPSRHLLTAGTGDQKTIAIDRLGGSVFTAAVLDGLREGLADSGNGQYPADGLVSVEELKLYVSSRVADEARISGWTNPITPQLREMQTSNGAFFFAVPEGRYGTRRNASLRAAQDGDVITDQGDTAPPAPTSDAQIAVLQEGLAELGLFSGPPDGTLTLETQKAIGQFQGAEGLPITGTPNEATRQALLQQLIAAKQEPAPQAPDGATFQDCAACPPMIPLPGGTATLGTTWDAHPEEGPEHQVTLAPFAMAQTEVTGAQWAAYLAANPQAAKLDPRQNCYRWDFSSTPPRMRQSDASQIAAADQPQNCVSHRDAIGYVDWLNTITTGGYRLPTEGEMEYALRAQTLPTDPAKACTLMNGALGGAPFNRGGACPVSSPLIKPAASFEPNPLGLYDLYGNLWELSHNCWTQTADAFATWAQDLGPCTSGGVTVRGASFDDPPANYRPTIRQQVPNIRRQENIGFRVVKFPLTP